MEFTVDVPKTERQKTREAVEQFERDKKYREARDSFIELYGRTPDREFEP